MRIGLRSDPKRRAFIFVPTEESEFIVRLMRLFPGAQFVGHGATPALIEDAPSLPPATAVAPSPVAGRIIEPALPPSQSEIDDTFGPARYEGTEEDTAEVAPAEFVVTDHFKEGVMHFARTLAREQRVRLPEDEGRNDLERVASDWRRSNPGRSPEDLDTMDWAERLIEMHRHPRQQELDQVLSALDYLLSTKAKDQNHFMEMARAVRDRVASTEMLAILDAVPKDDPELLAQRPYTAARQIIGGSYRSNSGTP